MSAVLVEKCKAKGLAVPTAESVLEEPRRAALEADWKNMLAHQLPALPPIADFIDELPRVFAWLSAPKPVVELPSVTAVDEMPLAPRGAPIRIKTWRAGIPLESIRFAAVNRLCVSLRYNGSARLIEPYALRETRDGNLVLHAVRVTDREHRSYRVDRMQGVEITSQTFVPQYAIEFASSGPITAPRTVPSNALRPPGDRTGGGSRSRSGSGWAGVTYEIQCPYCQKRFKRSSASDTRLHEHKDQYGQRCYGSGKRGYHI